MSLAQESSAMVGAAAWRRTAGHIADELGLSPEHPRTAKVSSLLHAFRCQGVHCDIDDMLEALRGQGVAPTTRGSTISRRDVLDLHLVDADAATFKDDRGIRVSRWRTGDASRPQPLTEDGDDSSTPALVVWFDVDPRGADPTPEDVDEIASRLTPSCPGLNRAIVRDLLTPDVQPKSETYGDERTGVRTVSVPALVAREIPDDDDDFDGVDEQLVVQIVELVVGPGWLITCWHDSRTMLGNGVVTGGPPLLREPFLDHVAHRWLNDEPDPAGSARSKDAGDLAIYLARSLVATFGASLRMLQRWVSTWEVEFYKTLGGEHSGGETRLLKSAAVEISNFLAVAGEFSRCVNAFKLAGDEMPNDTWFGDPDGDSTGQESNARGDQAHALGSSVDAAIDKLERLYEEIRADMDLLMIHSQARQQESSERLQGYLGKVTGLILVPTFVAGLFGANTRLPGQGSWSGFDLMLILMALSAAGSYWFIRKVIA